MDEMPREVLMQAPEFKAMFEYLQKVGLEELVWQTLGRIASSMVSLATALGTTTGDTSIKPIVEKMVKYQLEKSIGLVMKCSAAVKTKLLPLFVEKDHISKGAVEELGIVLATPETGPNKVLRSVNTKNALVLASPEMAFVLHHHLFKRECLKRCNCMTTCVSLQKE